MRLRLTAILLLLGEKAGMRADVSSARRELELPIPKLLNILLACAALFLFLLPPTLRADPIDRHALVTRHTVVLQHFDPANPLTVGNGKFAFTVDATGLQTFPEAFADTTPLGTLSDWGWHTFPNPNHYDLADYHFKEYPDLNGRLVPYCDQSDRANNPEAAWLRANPHRLHLGQIGFVLTHADGTPAQTNDLSDIKQTLDLWNGEIRSHFTFDGQPVDVETLCDATQDVLAIQVVSPLAAQGRLAIKIHFPYGTGDIKTADWTKPAAHTTTLTRFGAQAAIFSRQLDNDAYSVAAQWSPGGTLTNPGPHEYLLHSAPQSDTLELICAFSPVSAFPLSRFPLSAFPAIHTATQKHWNQFWSTGGAIDLSGSKDPRWFELERRIVLSEYLTAIQSAGQNPPQETGLTYNSWEGKFHLEMHFWHEAHFALWDRIGLLENSLGYYQRILPRAQGTAAKQGYAGARWPKMTSPSGVESPSPVGPFLIWEEPHPIFYCELAYRAHPDRATLDKYSEIVAQTAEFMASYATWDTNTHRYVLGPILQCAQERFPKNHTYNPTFELTYWRWGLETAQQWRARLGLPRQAQWDAVLQDLAKPSVSDGKYLFTETTPDSYTNPKWNDDHPAVLGALSFVPGPRIDPATMRHTLDWVWQNWNWPNTWGWDYPLLAMTAARLGEPGRAVDALLLDTPKNHYGLNGHVYQRPGLTIYLPANGGLLYATALMAAGWDGAPNHNAPGFPADGTWSVRWENLKTAP